MERKRKPLVVSCDAGGTMTDIFAIDEEGDFTIGKAPTTPHDESIGFIESLKDALSAWGLDIVKDDPLSSVSVIAYSGTTMINALLQRKGYKIGLVVTAGFEDILLQERGAQTWVDLSYQDRLHAVTHYHNPPLVPRNLVRGVTERIDQFGRIVIPLYEREAEQVVKELLDESVEGIAVCFLWSFVNSSHEQKFKEIATKVMSKYGKNVPIVLSSDVSPILLEHSRTNCTVVQAKLNGVVRNHLFKIEEELKKLKYKSSLYIITASGGLVNIRYPRLVESVVSGPIGGLLGAKYLSSVLGLGDYIVTADLGGTSYDVGIITGGLPFTDREIHVVRHILNLPILTMHNIGAGTGHYIKVDPARKSISIGPESAGAVPGPVCYDAGNETPTLMDAYLILGYMNPDYYLGGKIKLNVDKAYKFFREKVAEPLGLDVYKAAEGVLDLSHTTLRERVRTVLLSRGLHPADYYLLVYGGAGPMAMAFFSEGMEFKGVFTVPFAAAFSAFGLAIDYAHRYQKSIFLYLPPNADDKMKMDIGEKVNQLWDELEAKARNEITSIGFPWEKVRVQKIAYIRYGGQLFEIETPSPIIRIEKPEDMDRLIKTFEDLYERAYSRIAKYPEAGYQILNVGLVASLPLVKPRLRKYTLADEKPSDDAFKGEREVFCEGKWQTANTWEMDMLCPRNVIRGLSIIEAPNTTLIVPKGKKVVVDEYKLLWLEKD